MTNRIYRAVGRKKPAAAVLNTAAAPASKSAEPEQKGKFTLIGEFKPAKLPEDKKEQGPKNLFEELEKKKADVGSLCSLLSGSKVVPKTPAKEEPAKVDTKPESAAVEKKSPEKIEVTKEEQQPAKKEENAEVKKEPLTANKEEAAVKPEEKVILAEKKEQESKVSNTKADEEKEEALIKKKD